MKIRLFLALSLVAVLLVSDCAPSSTEPAAQPSPTPDLHATDPTTVSLATGQLHFVEFFRFT